MMRRADLALGGDGEVALPYWGWERMEVNGEVCPKLIRELSEEFNASVTNQFYVSDPEEHYDLTKRSSKSGEKYLLM